MQIESVAVIGASDLGRKIAFFSLHAGYRTILEDISISALDQGIAAIRAMFSAEHSRTGLGTDQNGAWAERLVTARTVDEAVRDADLIIEAVTDEPEMKLELFTIFDKFAKPAAIFASTTTSLSISDLAEMTFRPERCIGMRFLADGSDAARLELVQSRYTSQDTVAACRLVGQRMGVSAHLIHEAQTLAAGGE